MTRLRSFIALPLHADTITPVSQLQQKLADRYEGFRPAALRNLHLTLFFLGTRSMQELEKITSVMLSVGHDIPAFELILTSLQLIGRNPRKRPLCLDVRAPSELLDLHRSLHGKITGCGIELEKRSYRPHLTLGRINSPWPTRKELNLLHQQELALKANSICLYSSQLLPQGARHELLCEAALKNK